MEERPTVVIVRCRLRPVVGCPAEMPFLGHSNGQVVAAHDVVVDVRFAPEDTPVILSGACVAPGQAPVLAGGAAGARRPGALLTPLDADTLAWLVPILHLSEGYPTSQVGGDRTPALETGIKAIDLFCPFTQCGTVGIFGPSGNGRMVISAEVLRNIAR